VISSAPSTYSLGGLPPLTQGSPMLLVSEPLAEQEDAALLAQRAPLRRFLGGPAGAPPSPADLAVLAEAALHHEGWLLRSAPAAMFERVTWFERLLLNLAPADREAWVAQEIRRGQAHPMAATSLLARLEPLLDKPTMQAAQRCRLQALWLAVAATGPIRLDPHLRDDELRQAAALLNAWLAETRPT
jgi:hypothetical protein